MEDHEMSSAGAYPIVRGPDTLQKFFDAIVNYAPPTTMTLRAWIKSSGLTSSYYDDIPAFARFIGLFEDDGPTEMWPRLRGESGYASVLSEALRSAYDAPLKHADLERVETEGDIERITRFIRTNANVANDKAEAAAFTMARAFALAGGTPGVTKNKPPTARGGNPARGKRGKGSRGDQEPAKATSEPRKFGATLAVNLQVVLPSDATDERYDAMLAAISKHLGALLDGR